jgi:uncharacterized protein (DUF2141 family)
MSKFWFFCFFLFSFTAHAEDLSLKITNLDSKGGQLGIAVFDDPDAFPDGNKKTVFRRFYPVLAGTPEMIINLNLPSGSYAMAVFLDNNKNQKLDTNMVGVPTEKFGFSQNPKILFGAPNFSEAKFEIIPQIKKQLTIKLIKIL